MSIRLHHVAFASPRAEDAVRFYTQDWGLRETGRDGDEVRLAARLDGDDDYSLVIRPGAQKAVDHFCLVASDEAEVAALRERAVAGGVRLVDDAPLSAGIVSGFVLVDLDGRRVEVGYRPDGEPGGESRDAVPLKVAHIVLNTPDIKAATEWYRDKLGFGVRDWREEQMSFLFSGPDHHTVAFNAAPHVSLNHVAWELPDINEFFRAVGRATGTEVGEKLYGPGRHGPGDYVFCYFLDPSGFIAEYETDGVKVADPAEYEFRVWRWSPESADQWLGTLSGGVTRRFRECAVGEPDPAVVAV